MRKTATQLTITIPDGAPPGSILSIPVKGRAETIRARVPEGLGPGSTLVLTQQEGSDEWVEETSGLGAGLAGGAPDCGDGGLQEPVQQGQPASPGVLPQPPEPEPGLTPDGPVAYTVRLETSAGVIDIIVRPDWAPHGARRFLELAACGDLDGLSFYRSVKGCLAQFGLPARRQWPPLPDDPPTGVPFLLGAVCFAAVGKNSRKSTLFICIGDMSHCFGQSPWETPIGAVAESSLDALDCIETIYGDIAECGGAGPDTSCINAQGDAYLRANFPLLTYISSARPLDWPPPGEAALPEPVQAQQAERFAEATQAVQTAPTQLLQDTRQATAAAEHRPAEPVVRTASAAQAPRLVQVEPSVLGPRKASGLSVSCEPAADPAPGPGAGAASRGQARVVQPVQVRPRVAGGGGPIDVPVDIVPPVARRSRSLVQDVPVEVCTSARPATSVRMRTATAAAATPRVANMEPLTFRPGAGGSIVVAPAQPPPGPHASGPQPLGSALGSRSLSMPFEQQAQPPQQAHAQALGSGPLGSQALNMSCSQALNMSFEQQAQAQAQMLQQAYSQAHALQQQQGQQAPPYAPPAPYGSSLLGPQPMQTPGMAPTPLGSMLGPASGLGVPSPMGPMGGQPCMGAQPGQLGFTGALHGAQPQLNPPASPLLFSGLGPLSPMGGWPTHGLAP